jgi:FKBP-type peptidyl-prolyl cis-trans isomerase
VAQNTSAPTTSKTPSTSTKKTPAAKTGTTAQTPATQPKPLTTPKDKASYALGYNLGRNLQGQLVDVDPATVAQGFKDAFSGSKQRMTDEEIRSALTQLQQDTRAKQQAMVKELAEKNRKQGEEFLAANKSKEGVVTLPSGLQYKALTTGTGQKPTANDTVEANYRGTLVDGTEFDSSAKHGGPQTFPVTGVIKGWTEALQLMPVGSKWQVFVPANLAYGDASPGGEIPPGSALIFEIELLSIKPPASAKPAEAAKPSETTKPNEPPKPNNPAKPNEPPKPQQ